MHLTTTIGIVPACSCLWATHINTMTTLDSQSSYTRRGKLDRLDRRSAEARFMVDAAPS